jgi:hypothetical protein
MRELSAANTEEEELRLALCEALSDFKRDAGGGREGWAFIRLLGAHESVVHRRRQRE